MAELSRRPYLLRAMFDWMIDSGFTPHLIVDATWEAVQVPVAFVKEGRIVLNVSPGATQSFLIGAEAVDFNARFGGVSHRVHVPIDAVLGIYARETGQGMVFSEDSATPPAEGDEPDPESPPPAAPTTGAGRPEKPGRPKLTVVK